MKRKSKEEMRQISYDYYLRLAANLEGYLPQMRGALVAQDVQAAAGALRELVAEARSRGPQ